MFDCFVLPDEYTDCNRIKLVYNRIKYGYLFPQKKGPENRPFVRVYYIVEIIENAKILFQQNHLFR